jgi:hypothetical protein
MLENWQVDKTFRFILASGVIWWVQNIWWSDPPPWWSHLSEPPGRPSRLVQKGLFQSIEALPIAPCVHQGFGQSLLGDWRGPEDWRIRNWMEPENPISSWFLVLVESLIPVFSHELGWNTLYHKHWLFYQVSGVALLGMVFSLPDENVEGRMLSDQQIPHLFVENKITVYPTIGLKC